MLNISASHDCLPSTNHTIVPGVLHLVQKVDVPSAKWLTTVTKFVKESTGRMAIKSIVLERVDYEIVSIGTNFKHGTLP